MASTVPLFSALSEPGEVSLFERLWKSEIFDALDFFKFSLKNRDAGSRRLKVGIAGASLRQSQMESTTNLGRRQGGMTLDFPPPSGYLDIYAHWYDMPRR